VPFFALSARYSATALLISPSLSANLKRSAVAMYTMYLEPDLTTFSLSPADSSLSAASAFPTSRMSDEGAASAAHQLEIHYDARHSHGARFVRL